jgi:hypothetical protein
MKICTRRIIQISFSAMLACSAAAIAGDDDDDDKATAGQQTPTLNAEQQRAVGIIVVHPVAAKSPERTPALGLVLDSTSLLADVGEVASAGAAERSTAAEIVRLQGLYSGGAGASLKMLEAAQADQAKTHAQAESANARFAQHWGPIATLPASDRQKLVEAATSRHSLLVRADLPGRHSLGVVPGKAMLDVDGIEVPGRVLGILAQDTEAQSVGLLLEVTNAPDGLGPGARIPVALLSAQRPGLLLPRDALLYDENGAYVYKQLNKKPGDESTRYVPVKVTLLVADGDGWLVDGVDDDDDIVVHGAGVLWSLQAMGGHAVDDDDDD